MTPAPRPSPPVTLAIDTAGPRLQLALLGRDGAIHRETEEIARGHAEIIMDRIGALLARAGTPYGDLERVACTSGPGSFTGLRIGLSVARGLGLALSIPVLGVPTLVALSLGHPAPGEIVLDARRGEVYRQPFAGPGVPAGPAVLAPAEAPPPPAIVDIGAMARFAAEAAPGQWPPVPTYIRAADAKPQTRGKVALQ